MSDLDRLKTHVTDAVDQMAEDLWSLSLQIHANPELAFKEEKAASWLTAFLERQGCRVVRGVGGVPTPFRGGGSGAGRHHAPPPRGRGRGPRARARREPPGSRPASLQGPDRGGRDARRGG